MKGAAEPARDRWFGVELRHLAALAAVAEAGSFRGAADQLGYVQSAVSQQIAALERLIGARLVKRSRGPRPVTVTEAGRILLFHADGIVSGLRAARADLEALSSRSGRPVRIGVEPSVTRRVLCDVLRELAAEAPKLEPVPVEIADQRRRLALLEDGELDATFVDQPSAPKPAV